MTAPRQPPPGRPTAAALLLLLAASLLLGPTAAGPLQHTPTAPTATQHRTSVLTTAADALAATPAASNDTLSSSTGSYNARAPPVAPPAGDFDFYLLALFWPPSQVPVEAHGRARHLMHQQEASTGFWTHGLWPDKFAGVTETCTTEVFKPEALGPFQTSLMYYLQLPFPTNQPSKLFSFWGHEWQRHGTCSKLDQLSYFMQLYQASMQTNVLQTLSTDGIKPSNAAPYKIKQVHASLTSKYGPAFQPSKSGLWCVKSPGGQDYIAEVRICLNKGTLAPVDCSKMQASRAESFREELAGSWEAWDASSDEPLLLAADLRALGLGPAPPQGGQQGGQGQGQRPPVAPPALYLCPAGPEADIWLPDFLDDDAVVRLPWDIIFVMTFQIILLLGLFVLGYQTLQKWNLISSLFVSKDVAVVHYDLVQLPVKVLCEHLDMERLWATTPVYAEFVHDLPVGMGIKGGIARKLLKEMYGEPEPPGSFDVDVLLLIDEYTPHKRKAARELVAGMKLGGLVLEPQDTEVLTKEWLSEYFITRDVTQNEVLILKVAPGKALFFYTQDAKMDVQLQLIRPAVHCLNSEFNMSWELEDDGTPYTAPQQVCRALVRYLKGHGRDYAFDKATWMHYRKNKLNKTHLFKVLKPFHDNDQKLLNAVGHLIDIGFLSREEVRKAGGVNMLWGLLLQEINTVVSRFGSRMCLKELDLDAVERWVDQKKATVAARKVTLEMRARRTGFVPSDESVINLRLLSFPQELTHYIAQGPTFSPEAHLTETASTLVQSLAAAKIASIESYKTLKSVAQQSGEAAFTLAHQASGSGGSGSSGAAAGGKGGGGGGGSGWFKPQGGKEGKKGGRGGVEVAAGGVAGGEEMRDELDAEIEKLRGLLVPSPSPSGAQAGQNKAMSQTRIMDEMRNVTHEQSKRKNKEYREQVKGKLDRTSSAASLEKSAASGSGTGTAQEQAQGAELSRLSAASAGSDGEGGSSWVRASELRERLEPVSMLPGTFYQLVPTGETGEETEYVPLVTGKDVPQKTRVDSWRLMHFLIGVMNLQKLLLLGSYTLMLGGLMFRLCLPRIEAAIFDAFNDLDSSLFQANLITWMIIVGADVLLSLSGGITMELFSRRSMRTLFRRFFEHVVFQDLPFFDRLSPGELMARTSGDSLTLRSIISSTIYQLTEGTILFTGSVIFLLWSTGPLLLQQPGILGAFFLVLLLNVMEAGLLGLWLRSCNLKVRQALGRMFGFTLDAFSKIETVAVLGLEPRMLLDYSQYARDYFTFAFYMNSSLHVHRAFTYSLSALLLAALMWFGGAALFKDLTTVGTLFALLRYVHWTQKGMKQASNAYARIMAGMGSVERIVELHDRGVFGGVAAHEPGEGPDARGREEDAARGANGRTGLFKTWSTHRDEVGEPLLRGDEEEGGGGSAGRPAAAAPAPAPLVRAGADLRPQKGCPDYTAMMGGLWLKDIHLTMRSKTDRLLLHDCTLELESGQLAVVQGDEFESKSGLLSLMMLRLVPYKGHIAFQLPNSAVPPEAAGQVAGGGTGWKWVTFDFHKDDVHALRSRVGVAGVSCCGIFRTTVEDNIAIATPREVASSEVRDVCRLVGAHDGILQLSDGYSTLVGDGTGNVLSQQMALRISLARAIIRRPALLLLDNGDLFAEAVGAERLVEVLSTICQQGGCVVVASNRPSLFKSPTTKVYSMQMGKLLLQ